MNNYLIVIGTGHLEARSEIGKLKMEMGKTWSSHRTNWVMDKLSWQWISNIDSIEKSLNYLNNYLINLESHALRFVKPYL